MESKVNKSHSVLKLNHDQGTPGGEKFVYSLNRQKQHKKQFKFSSDGNSASFKTISRSKAQDLHQPVQEHFSEFLKPNYDIGKPAISYSDLTLKSVTKVQMPCLFENILKSNSNEAVS